MSPTLAHRRVRRVHVHARAAVETRVLPVARAVRRDVIADRHRAQLHLARSQGLLLAERVGDEVAPAVGCRRTVEASRELSVEVDAETVGVPPTLVVGLGRTQTARAVVVVERAEVLVATRRQVVPRHVRRPRDVVVLGRKRTM